MNFFKRVLSTVTGIFVFFSICIVFLLLIGFIFGANSDSLVAVKPNSVLQLKLDFPIKDYAGKIEFKDYPFLNEEEKNGLFNIINAIKYAETDDNIKGISIENNFINAGISQTKALRDALLEFKESGKFITAYSDIYSQKDYYLSSVADSIYLNPTGILEFKGLSSEQLYFKDFQENTGLKFEVVRFGKYKSAVEPFLLNEMSDENREQIFSLMNTIWYEIKKEISESRMVSVEQLNNIADSLLTRNASLAIASKLVDKVGYYDEYVNSLKNVVGVNLEDDLETITVLDYVYSTSNKLSPINKNKIAVIFAEGEIIYGEGDVNYVGQGTMRASLEKARKDDNIKAVVLRINSPGGSALASELIWREIELTKKIKPVIVSMGDLAASGGYYIACNADKIIAEPTTITGSIGVFGLLPNVKGLADNWGINAEQVVTNTNAITYSLFEPLSEMQHDFLKEGIIDVYELFTNRVAVGRNMSQDAVKNIAEGRVWTGVDALNNGLVDELGGLDLALQRAAEFAEIEDYKVSEFPVFEKDLDKIFESFGLIKSKETILMEELGEENYKILKEIKTMSQRKGVQLLLPYRLDIK
ncbi:signal peptide peptidase SppA [Pseudalgibacter alginicilyticus]|uniref:Signal peptide peptidase SppA n=1 Tax=Pseudalgibacter alginicilyticus TaxID=1736674 RepID=A0A0P0D7S5_9FLAO|nr:signal peptide peptidase SppA [Pseudalgibacter alginicilyticus]ALJ03663.1 signal peptide peptidase SppA [Pseudalgibacter alginicilyticus]